MRQPIAPKAYELIRDAGNLLDAMARHHVLRAAHPKSDPLILRHNALIPRIRLVTDYDSVYNMEAQKLQKPPGWTPSKAESAAIKKGEFVMHPEPVLPHTDTRALIHDLFALIDDFPYLRNMLFAGRYADLLALKKAPGRE